MNILIFYCKTEEHFVGSDEMFYLFHQQNDRRDFQQECRPWFMLQGGCRARNRLAINHYTLVTLRPTRAYNALQSPPHLAQVTARSRDLPRGCLIRRKPHCSSSSHPWAEIGIQRWFETAWECWTYVAIMMEGKWSSCWLRMTKACLQEANTFWHAESFRSRITRVFQYQMLILRFIAVDLSISGKNCRAI